MFSGSLFYASLLQAFNQTLIGQYCRLVSPSYVSGSLSRYRLPEML
ncbi:hypothetical protein EIKCOROL_02115 [Eikenella corrodens ATCC 23834]|uniref:Uncharacterized protein n=1 Tax=Eikenella corrodens ATCC 23834 TaxID=546274 RepID=C0DXK4_EIKCO|nr:hypothetical protein EIKCOROL_02115 [Eikenella corrodens ATCC 23834]